MLSHISIKNFGLIDQLVIDFCGELNILTGETGAGKSILLDALRFALGDRLNSAQVRDAALPCSVEAVFELSRHKELLSNEHLKEYLSDEETSLILSRIYMPDGRNKIKVNGFSLTVSQLKNIGNFLVDFHGPHDHQMLLNEEMHLGILDRLAQFADFKKTYQSDYKDYVKVRRQISELEGLKQSRERELDMLSHQVKELEAVSLENDVYEELKGAKAKLNNTERLFEEVSRILEIFDNESSGINEQIGGAYSSMQGLNQIDESTAGMGQLLDQIQEISSDLSSQLRDYAESLSFEPQEASEIHEKSDLYDDILKKYGPTLDEAKSFYEKAKEQYDLLANLEQSDADLNEQLKSLESKLSKASGEITKIRKKTALALKKTIEAELTQLGIKHVEFEARVEKADFSESGSDTVTFYISPNIGETLKPLAEIVSSGEAARVMLALKKALTKVDPIPVLIFDEIDAQIGGRLGTIIGRKLKEIAGYRQVILITHLPQIASFGKEHFKVIKSVKNGRAVTLVEPLSEQNRIDELANMLSGESKSKISVSHAQDLLEKAGQV